VNLYDNAGVRGDTEAWTYEAQWKTIGARCRERPGPVTAGRCMRDGADEPPPVRRDRDAMSLPPLPDLHRHLDGSLRERTLRELAGGAGIEVPDDVSFFPGLGLRRALARFRITLGVLQRLDALARVAAECCEDATAEGVTTLELRFAPQLHRCGEIEEVVDAALQGIAGRAGLVLCGLYGDPPALVERLVEVAADRPGVVGIDLAGGPAPDHRFTLGDYAPAFRRARDLGIGRTIHAGEGRPAAEIGEAIVLLHAERIGHGTSLLEDASVVELVIDRGVTLEACPTSNVHTGVLARVADHPLPRWLARGVRACVNTDNTLFSATSAPEEHRRALRIPGMTRERLEAAIAAGHAAAFRR
jgi:adenosine deaminase